jgi:hypothetical protein
VTWGETSKVFAAADLAKGINLAAEFLDNPFVEPFKKVHAAVCAQQQSEIPMIQKLVHGVHEQRPFDGERLKQVVASAGEKQQALQAAAARAVTPVTHTIRLELVQ